MISDQEREVLTQIDEGQGEIVDCLQSLISFKTITPPGDEKVEAEHQPEPLEEDVQDELRSILAVAEREIGK